MFGWVQVARGWVWHTRYRMTHFWSWRREGSLIAAAAVLMLGSAQAIFSSTATKPAPVEGLVPVAAVTSTVEAPVTLETATIAGEIAAPPTIAAAAPPAGLVDDGITAASKALDTASIGEAVGPVEVEGDGEDLIAQKLFDDQVEPIGAVPDTDE